MIRPLMLNTSLYKGANYIQELRFALDGERVNLTDCVVRFNAAESAGGTNVLSYTSGESPDYVTIDAADDYLVTINIPPSVTEDISNPDLYYEIDIEDAGGIVSRWVNGTITVHEDAQ